STRQKTYDQDGEVLTTDYFDGSVTVLNFIFTRCSIAEMCPASTMRMKKLQTLASQTKVPHVKFLSNPTKNCILEATLPPATHHMHEISDNADLTNHPC
ncbi:MAG TPA: hypothetical protein DEP88_08860, partial [Verrucomicrobiales bacterium]|nr:hypothetical protein [Verrucomicrobiales bacterium]